MIINTFYIKPIICSCCKKLIKTELENSGINVIHISSGYVTMAYDEFTHQQYSIEKILNNIGFQIIVNKEKILVDLIKKTVIELIHFANNMNSIIRNTDYLVEKLNCSYFYLSAVFAKYEQHTLDDFIEFHKIEKAKELFYSAELDISEIAHILGYTNAIEFEKNFFGITGVSSSDFIRNPQLECKLMIEV